MRIRLTQMFAGPGQFIGTGVETDVDEEFGRQLVGSGHAVSLEIEEHSAPVIETATNNPPRPERQGRKPRAQ